MTTERATKSLPVPKLYEGDEATAVAEFVRGPRVLDCGCGTGRIARAVRPSAESVWGIELSGSNAASARAVCDQVIEGSLTDPATWDKLEGETFDAILFIHVLEHLTEPEIAIRAAAARLRQGGSIVVALPNVANWRLRWELARGRWEYRDEGIMDRTHVKFYTLRTAIELLTSNGLEIRSIRTYLARPAGGIVRRGLVRGFRRAAPLLCAHSFVFNTVLS